jgi:hypothetical protein
MPGVPRTGRSGTDLGKQNTEEEERTWDSFSVVPVTASGVRVRAGGVVATKGRGPRPSGLLILIITYHTYLHAPPENSDILNVLLVSDVVSIINSSLSIIIYYHQFILFLVNSSHLSLFS